MNDYIPTSEFSFELAFVSLYCGGKLGNRCSDLLEHANMQAWTLLEKLSCHFFKGAVSNFFSFLIEKTDTILINICYHISYLFQKNDAFS